MAIQDSVNASLPPVEPKLLADTRVTQVCKHSGSEAPLDVKSQIDTSELETGEFE